MVSFMLRACEKDILDAIQHLRYGELYDVSVEDYEEASEVVQIHPVFKAFFFELRREKHFDLLKVHDGKPSIAEKNRVIRGITAVEKFKFN